MILKDGLKMFCPLGSAFGPVQPQVGWGTECLWVR